MGDSGEFDATGVSNSHSLEIGDIGIRIKPNEGKPIDIFLPQSNPYFFGETIENFIKAREKRFHELNMRPSSPDNDSLIHMAYITKIS